MDQRGGVMATVALLFAAVIGISYLPRKSSETPTAAAGQKTTGRVALPGAKTVQQTTGNGPIASCEQIQRRLTRFYPEGVPIPPQGNCYANGAVGPTTALPNTAPVSFAIAIVPNPVQTHLPLVFDRQIDSLQQAAQDTGFTYDGSWFPWNQTDKSYQSLSDEQQSAQLESDLQQQPGIMVFRHGASAGNRQGPYDSGLVIFLVAEQPTGGISDTQFTHALQWMAALQAKPDSQGLRIVGPTFSGSLASLARELRATGALAQYPWGIKIFSGSANSESDIDWFHKDLPSVEFSTFFEGDRLTTDRFLCYMQHEGYDLNHFAILSEDQTAFGKAAGTDPAGEDDKPRCVDHQNRYEGRPVYLYYPRDIASLRSAYEQQSIFSAGKPQSNAPNTSLKSDLSEPASSEHDTVRTYGGQLTPQAQEAVLFSIANVLDNKHIEFVIIRSSNTLDQLFLSEFLRRSYPNGRVVIDGSDLLFRRGVQGASLRGVMLLSPYPLLSWTHDAVATIEGGRSSSYRLFTEDLSQGTYIAARELLKEVPGAAPVVAISDYAPPRLDPDDDPARAVKQRPATWLTVVGHRQFWPLAVLNEHTEVEDNAAGTGFGPYGPASLLKLEPVDTTPSRSRTAGLPGEMWGLLLACMFLALWHYYCCARGSIFRPPRLRAYFAPIARLQHTLLIFIGSLLLGYLGATLWFVVVFGLLMLTPLTTAGALACVFMVFASAFLGCVKNYRLPLVQGETGPRRQKAIERIQGWRRRLPWLWVPSLGALALLRYLYLTHHLNFANRFPAYWRSVFLRSGVSPLLPQVLLILGLYAWFWYNLHGLSLFGDDRPVLPKVDDLPQYQAAADNNEEAHAQHTRLVKVFHMFSREGSGNNIEANALPLGAHYLKSLPITLPVAYVVLLVALGGPSLRTLGDRRFGAMIFLGVAICVGLILADVLQLLSAWSQLRRLLVFLDRLRLRRTLATLRGLYGGSVWKLSGNVLEERYRLLSRQFESMRNLQNALLGWPVSSGEEALRKQIAIEQLKQCEKDGQNFAMWYVDLLDDEITRPEKESDITLLTEFQNMLAATAGCIMKQVIMPAWQSDEHSLIRVSGPKNEEADFDKLVATLPPHVSAAEEFFLLPYMGFVQNTLGRVRTIGLSIVILFVAATLSVSSYPFDPLPVIGAIFLILFVLVGSVMVFTYAEMSRDATLSRISDTTPGELGRGFFLKMAALGAGPLLGLLTTLFPSMTDFIVSFLQPGAQALK